MEENQKKCYEIAERIYDLDVKVYESVGSALGRTFTDDRQTCVENLTRLMTLRPQGHLLRSELALISNMARTIKDEEVKAEVMTEYDAILKAVAELPDGFGKVDILNKKRAKLNTARTKKKFKKGDHLVICIGRTQGSAGNDECPMRERFHAPACLADRPVRARAPGACLFGLIRLGNRALRPARRSVSRLFRREDARLPVRHPRRRGCAARHRPVRACGAPHRGALRHLPVGRGSARGVHARAFDVRHE